MICLKINESIKFSLFFKKLVLWQSSLLEVVIFFFKLIVDLGK